MVQLVKSTFRAAARAVLGGAPAEGGREAAGRPDPLRGLGKGHSQ